MTVRIGYKASAEQFGPRELLAFSLAAEERRMDSVAVSDHFRPWSHRGGHAPAAVHWLAALGQASSRARLGTSVLTPTSRCHPSMVAQSYATLATMNPGRMFLGVGFGEAINETPATGDVLPGGKERRLRLAEAIELMRRLWSEERVDFDGDYYRVSRATVYDRPEQPIPIYVAASGPLAARLAGRAGDGFICTSGKDPELYTKLLGELAVGARSVHRDPSSITRMIEIKVSYDRDADRAREACRWWAALAREQKGGIEDPVAMERVADARADRADTGFIVSDDPDEVVERIGEYLDLGFDDLILHAPGDDQQRFIEHLSEDVMPKLRLRAEIARLSYIRQIIAWMSRNGAWSEGMIVKQTDDTPSEALSPDLAVAKECGLLQREGAALRLTELGGRVADGFGDALRDEPGEAQADRLSAVAADVDRRLTAEDALGIRYLAEVLAWLGGTRVSSEANDVAGVGEDRRARVVRDLEVAVAAGVLTREDGGVRLTERGWELVADDE